MQGMLIPDPQVCTTALPAGVVACFAEWRKQQELLLEGLLALACGDFAEVEIGIKT